MTGRLADGEPDALETLHGATMPGLRRVKIQGLDVERRDDAAATNDVEVRGHVAWNVCARAQAWHCALCRLQRSRRPLSVSATARLLR